LDLLVALHKDLRDERLVPWGCHDEVDVRRPVRRSFGRSQQLPDWAVSRNGISRRHQGDQVERSVLVRLEATAQVVVGLLLILILVQAVCRGLPGVEDRPLDRSVSHKVKDAPRNSNAGPWRVLTCGGRSSFPEWVVGSQEGSHQCKSHGLARLVVIERFDQLTHPNDVSEQQELVSGRAGHRRHPSHKVPGELKLFIGYLYLPDASMQVLDQCFNDLLEPPILNFCVRIQHPLRQFYFLIEQCCPYDVLHKSLLDYSQKH